MNWPESEVITELGTVRLAITSGSHVYVDGSGNGKFLMVRGKEVRASFHLELEGGEWKITNFYSSRDINARQMYEHATPAQRKEIEEKVGSAVVRWIRHNPKILKQAQVAHVGTEVESRKVKIAELQKEILEKEREIKELECTLS